MEETRYVAVVKKDTVSHISIDRVKERGDLSGDENTSKIATNSFEMAIQFAEMAASKQ